MKRTFLFISIFLSLTVASSAFGVPIRLYYDVTPQGGGRFNYDFNLVLDNHDGTWEFEPDEKKAQGWGWIIFGHALRELSPLTNFSPDFSDLPIGPFTGFGTSQGNDNGPTLFPINGNVNWTPSKIGDSLFWSGTSDADLSTSGLSFIAIRSINKAVKMKESELAIFGVPPSGVPEPATLLLFGVGLFGLISVSRRRFKK